MTTTRMATSSARPMMLEAALDYAGQGYSVFPCWPMTKEPATWRGFKDAVSNPATIRRWWLADPSYNIAIATGLASRVFVLDIDGAIGAETLEALEAKYGSLPATRISTTSGGCHFWFQTDRPIPCRTGGQGGFPPGLDIRADGGYVMAPPSIHPDGTIYRWANARAIANAPDWLIQLARVKAKPTVAPHAHVPIRRLGPISNYAAAALEREINALTNTPPGARNHALNCASFSLHQLVAGGELDGAEVHARLIEAAAANGLMSDPADGPRSVERTIASGAHAGMQHPRNRRGPAPGPPRRWACIGK
jgi:Bifunctional DNA primase/polymerase, N-terminal